MKRAIFALVILSNTQPAQAQLLRRLFGGGQQHCQQIQAVQYYQPTYYAQAVNYQVVAAVPLATVPIAVDLQAYQYSVNAAAFQNFREYQNSKSEQQSTEAVPVARRLAADSGTALPGAEILNRS